MTADGHHPAVGEEHDPLSAARGIQRIATASDGSPFALFRNAALLKNAVLADGWAIDGPGRANTVVIDELGVFAKGGAEGVMVMAAPDGTTVTLKVLDGSLRAASIVALRLLADAGALTHDDVDAVAPKLDLAVLGRGVFTVLLAAALVCLLLIVTFDLDRPTRGLIQVPSEPIESVRASMELPPAAPAPSQPSRPG